MRKRSVFRQKLGADPPAAVQPFKTNLVPGARAIRCKGRHYTQEQSEFLKKFTDELKRCGLIYENPNAE